MKLAPQGYRVAVVGASSLLGKELLTVLEERRFPVSRLVKFETEDEEPELPIVDLLENFQSAVADQDVRDQDLDLAFVAAPPQATLNLPSFLRLVPYSTGLRPAPDGPGLRAMPGGRARPAARGVEAVRTSSAEERTARCVVIDLTETLAEAPGKVMSVPFLDRGSLHGQVEALGRLEAKFIISPHPAAILISSLLLRLAARFPLERAVAHVFEPVSEIGPRGIEELQKQTVNLLSFQKIPQGVFGAQLAFNLLPRLGRLPGNALTELEKRLRQQLREYLLNRAPLPALRLFQVPVFYSLAVSLYVETAKPESPEAIAQALNGEPLRVRRHSQPAPSQVEATGSSEILVDTITPDVERPAGVWIWAVADNVRLAAVNAVEIAESLGKLK